eukprot:1533117-Heterocapsa_arctica.AAC.1
MALEDNAESVNCMAEILSIEKVSSDAGVLLMVDSGACMSTCPRTWCDRSALKMDGKAPRAVTATGSPLVIYGTSAIRCTTWHGVEFELDFVVSDVTRPIVAVSDLLLQGIIPRFEAPACLIR